ncbi:hypothetical protein IQ244_12730 [Nostoc sp. LEGE 06077]|uniref:hypothetical protein n=1 Tax=Nostoc sp. LEGE 06077 TaxID=915325 RepID=UPI00187F490F|nr:hypothetical protein [Nostoc sp. LEGE 06077]MBE9207372.1 hypothetical protein [Nostoc sp. LEGE 06077]
MYCKLCLKNTDLRESHIIPETFYEEIYDNLHRMVFLSLKDTKLKFIQTGIKEKLLCHNCEQRFSRWENFLKRDLVDFGNKKSKYLKFPILEENFIQVEGIRYNEFKLAILSILWRLSVSSHPYHCLYKLGIHEDKLRHILLKGIAPDESIYPIIVTRHEIEKEFDPGIIMQFPPKVVKKSFTIPSHTIPPKRFEQLLTIEAFTIWGHTFKILINDNIFMKVNLENFLRKSGHLNIKAQELIEFMSEDSVLSRIYDQDVNNIYEKMIDESE